VCERAHSFLSGADGTCSSAQGEYDKLKRLYMFLSRGRTHSRRVNRAPKTVDPEARTSTTYNRLFPVDVLISGHATPLTNTVVSMISSNDYNKIRLFKYLLLSAPSTRSNSHNNCRRVRKLQRLLSSGDR